MADRVTVTRRRRSAPSRVTGRVRLFAQSRAAELINLMISEVVTGATTGRARLTSAGWARWMGVHQGVAVTL
jgi:hypothetical protein